MSFNLTADAMWSSFKDVMFTAFDQFVPIKSINNANNNGEIRRYPSYIRKQLNKKRMLWRICKSQPANELAKHNYRNAQLVCRRLLRKHALEKERRVLDSNDSGSFYKYVNKKLTRPSGVGSLLDKNGEIVSDNLSKANILNDYFASVCTTDNGKLPEFKNLVSDEVLIDTVTFTTENVLRCISKIKPKTSSGPDGLPAIALKNLRSCLACPLSELFTSFMSVGKVPSEWKSAIVTPIYKKGQPSACSNYRPISLTCTVCKIMERVIVLELSRYLRVNDLITSEQHGFLTKRSTSTNLLETLNDWTLAINNRRSVSTVYIDYSKAFDSVCHSKLFLKLQAYGITGNLLQWIKSLLTNRTQVTRVGCSVSNASEMPSGVIQGSCLGPLLFVLFINDVVTVFNDGVMCKLYADDIKLYCTINSNLDFNRMQSSIDALYNWSASWQLTFSVNKCASIIIGNQTVYPYSYNLHNDIIPAVIDIRDLGVHVDMNLKFNRHVELNAAAARKKIGLLFKCFTTRDPNILLRAYVTYIRPMLEYASTVWNPVYVGQLCKLESVQRIFTKRIPCLKHMTYNERLLALKLESLELRRLKLDLTMTYKIIFGLVDLSVNRYFVLRTNSSTRGHAFRIVPEKPNVNCRNYFFSLRITNVWNKLPNDIVNFNSLTAFKSSLDRVDFSLYVSF